jgi:hypothetical protein
MADPESDFAGLTIVRLGLSGQRREAVQATRWLDDGERELLALWWLEAGGELDRGEIAAALELPQDRAAARVARMRERLAVARVVIRALQAVPRCGGVADATADWDQVPSALWRERIAGHADACPRCEAHYGDLIPAERLLAGLPLLPTAGVVSGNWLPPARPARPTPRPAPPPGPPAWPARPTPRPAHPTARPAPAPGRPARSLGHDVSLQFAARSRRRIMAKTAGPGQLRLLAATTALACAAASVVVLVHQYSGRSAALAGLSATAGPVPASPGSASPGSAGGAVPAVRGRFPGGSSSQWKPAATAAAAKKGVGAWTFSGASQALAACRVSWYYTWSASHAGIASPPDAQFIPMIWGAGDVNAATLSEVKSEGHILLGFNEPDASTQSNMTVAQALSLWPQLMATGMTLGSPAVALNAPTPGGWLDRFMTGAAARGYRVNFIALHWYGTDFATAPAVAQLKSYLQATYDRYHLPIWLTEFALANFHIATPSFGTPSQQAAFLTAATSMLDSLPYVQRYAWFGLGPSATYGTLNLFGSGPVATAAGQAFEAIDAAH